RGFAAHHAHHRQCRRPADPGRQPLPFRRDQPGAAIRPCPGARQAARYPRRKCGALRAGTVARGDADPVPRRPDRAGLPWRGHGEFGVMVRITRSAYADMFGPTTGDRVRLADTDLFVEVERDLTVHGEEAKFGGGKVVRDGMGQSQASQAQGAADTVINDVLIIDHWGIVKADVAITNGRIAGIGNAGNPDIQPSVDIIVGPGTEVIAGEGKILTAGGVDSHIHFISPQQVDDALASGLTTMIGGGTGPATGTFATT